MKTSYVINNIAFAFQEKQIEWNFWFHSICWMKPSWQVVIVVRWQQDKNGKKTWEDIEENPVGCNGEGKKLKLNHFFPRKKEINEKKFKEKHNKYIGIDKTKIFSQWSPSYPPNNETHWVNMCHRGHRITSQYYLYCSVVTL